MDTSCADDDYTENIIPMSSLLLVAGETKIAEKNGGLKYGNQVICLSIKGS